MAAATRVHPQRSAMLGPLFGKTYERPLTGGRSPIHVLFGATYLFAAIYYPTVAYGYLGGSYLSLFKLASTLCGLQDSNRYPQTTTAVGRSQTFTCFCLSRSAAAGSPATGTRTPTKGAHAGNCSSTSVLLTRRQL